MSSDTGAGLGKRFFPVGAGIVRHGARTARAMARHKVLTSFIGCR
jgi:hypothetical protein